MPTPESQEWEKITRALGVSFRNPALLQEALVHRSYLNENPSCGLAANERLEFLGDAVLGFIVAHWLYQRNPHMDEGGLTTLRSAIVRQETLAQAAARLSLGEHLLLGRGERTSGGAQRPANLACAFEAVVGAIFLDRGIAQARRFVLRALAPALEEMVKGSPPIDSKSLLQQVVQARWHTIPTYRTVSAQGPDHAKVFTVEVVVGEQIMGVGTGRSKRAAERAAAERALASLSDAPPAPGAQRAP